MRHRPAGPTQAKEVLDAAEASGGELGGRGKKAGGKLDCAEFFTFLLANKVTYCQPHWCTAPNKMWTDCAPGTEAPGALSLCKPGSLVARRPGLISSTICQ